VRRKQRLITTDFEILNCIVLKRINQEWSTLVRNAEDVIDTKRHVVEKENVIAAMPGTLRLTSK
jgi:hypothetical protein